MSKINWFPGHMKKALREIESQLKLVDVIVELVDARAPYATKNFVFDNLNFKKKKVLIITKIDMASQSLVHQAMNHYQNEGYTVFKYDLSKNNTFNKFFADLKDYKNQLIEKAKNKGLSNYKLKMMIIGLPNVGKSTFINRLVNKKVTSVANRAGHTKAQQWVNISSDISLLDTPGVMMPKIEDPEDGYKLALIGSVKREILHLDDIAIYLLKKIYAQEPKLITHHYNVELEEGMEIPEIIEAVCHKKGWKTKFSYDYEKFYLKLINDFQKGFFKTIKL